jgi:hypothetical protein
MRAKRQTVVRIIAEIICVGERGRKGEGKGRGLENVHEHGCG